jgi:hypothetical protein
MELSLVVLWDFITFAATKPTKTIMKKLVTLLMMATMALFTFTSCEDENIAYTLEGTWEGQVFDYSQWDGQTYNISYSMLDFRMDPFATRTGNGYWVDIYSGGNRHHVSYRIDWKVRDGIIYIKFREDGTTYRISDYRLSDYTFRGTMYEADWNTGNYNGNAHDFSMRHIDSPNWDYYYNDYDSFWGSYRGHYNGYYWSNEGTFESEDGSTVAPAKSYSDSVVKMAPKRHLIEDKE